MDREKRKRKGRLDALGRGKIGWAVTDREHAGMDVLPSGNADVGGFQKP